MKKILFIFILFSTIVFASPELGADNVYQAFESWLGGNLGKLLALIGFIGTFIIYIMTMRGYVLIIGIVISLMSGAIIGITQIFFKQADKLNLVNKEQFVMPDFTALGYVIGWISFLIVYNYYLKLYFDKKKMKLKKIYEERRL